MEQFNSGELKTTFRSISHFALIGLTVSGRKAWQEEEETRRDTSTVLILQEEQSDMIDLSVRRHAQYMHKAWKRHQDAVFWVDINFAFRKRLKFYQTRSNAIIHETLPAYFPKVVRVETGEVIFEKVFMSPRPPPKISLKHGWKRELGSEVARQPEGQDVQHFKSFQLNQQIPNPSRDRKGQPVVRTDRSGQPIVGAHTRTVQDGRKTSRSQEIDVNSFHEETVSSERSGQPAVETSKTQTRFSDDSKSLNVETAHDRSLQPVVETKEENVPDGCETRSCHESMRLNVEDETLRERSGQPVVNHDDSSHEQTILNEVNMDFRIQGYHILL